MADELIDLDSDFDLSTDLGLDDLGGGAGVLDDLGSEPASDATEETRGIGDSNISDTPVINQFQSVNSCLFNGDSCEVLTGLPSESIDFSVYSPPFASLYVYSNSERDLGNSRSEEEFFQHYRYIIDHIFRLTKPGRLTSVHCMNLPTTKQHDGVIGLSDFRGEIIREHIGNEAADIHRTMTRIEERQTEAIQNGDFRRVFRLESSRQMLLEELRAVPPCKGKWIYHSEVVIWKDPVTAMQRTKAIGLLHKQVVKDSAMSRQGIPDYVVTFRKPGVNQNPITGEFEKFIGDQETFRQTGNLSIDIWQRYASPVWMDIDMSDTLNKHGAREECDEAHVCPLQLGVVKRCLELWSKEGDVVLSPFAGIGSEGFVSVQSGRKFIGCELKPSYFSVACKNLRIAEESLKEKRMF